MISGPSSITGGSSVGFDVLVSNPGATITTTLFIEIAGPGGYRYFDTVEITVATSVTERFQFTWQAPSTPGTYQVNVGLISPTPTTISQTQIAVT